MIQDTILLKRVCNMDFIFVIVVLFSFLSLQISAYYSEEEIMKFRLPDDLKPMRYELILYPGKMTNEELSVKDWSIVQITINCVSETNLIWLNTRDLEINVDTIKVWAAANSTNHISLKGQSVVDSYYDLYKIELEKVLTVNEYYIIRIEFEYSYYESHTTRGYTYVPYRKDMRDYFQQEKLPEETPSLHYVTFTEMHDVYPRLVFPCFDQIDFKASFKTSIVRHSSVKAISNSNIAQSTSIYNRSGWFMDEFEEVESMSTFSVAFAVTAYNFKQLDIPLHGIRVRVYAEIDSSELMDKILKIASDSIVSFSIYFDSPFTLGKLDLMIVPDKIIDILDGYGLMILGENYALRAFDENEDIILYKYKWVSRICRSASKQYLGHLVTMSRWNETWVHSCLNDFLLLRCIGEVYPSEEFSKESKTRFIKTFLFILKHEELGVYNTIVSLDKYSFFTKYSRNKFTYLKDGVGIVNLLYHRVDNELKIVLITGPLLIMLRKFTSPVIDNALLFHLVFTMLNFILGEGIFQKSIQNYLKIYIGRNSNLEQIWEVFTNTATAEERNIFPLGITVRDIMESWLSQKGHPLIHVSKNNSTGEITVTQEPFSFIDENPQLESKSRWIIPLSYTTKSEMEFGKWRVRKWFGPEKTTIIRDAIVTEDDWVIMDTKLNVPLRINYDDSNWVKIKTLLRSKDGISIVDSSNRLRLISDMFVLARIGKLKYEFVFSILKYMKKEYDDYCWMEAFTELFYIRNRLLHWHESDSLEYFQQYLRDIMKNIVRYKINDVEMYLRNFKDYFGELLLKYNCIIEGTECQIFVEKLLDEWKPNADDVMDKLIPVKIRKEIYCFAIKRANKQQRKFLFDKYDASDSQKESSNLNDDILYALACVNQKKVLQNYLEWGMDERSTSSSTQQSSTHQKLKVFEAVASNKLGLPIIKSFLAKKIDTFYTLSRQTLPIEFVNYVKIALGMVTNMKELQWINVEIYLKLEKTDPMTARNLEEALANATKNIRWYERNEESVLSYFAPQF